MSQCLIHHLTGTQFAVHIWKKRDGVSITMSCSGGFFVWFFDNLFFPDKIIGKIIANAYGCW